MPELDLGNWKYGLDAWAGIRVLAVMLFPTNERRRDGCLELAHEQAPLEPSDPAAEPSLSYQHLDLAKLDYLTREKPVVRGAWAGEILLTVKQIHEDHQCIQSDEPSISKAVAVVAARQSNSPSSLEGAWRSYRSVAHLWAVLQSEAQKSSPELDPINPKTLPTFLALAEEIRRFGEEFHTGRGDRAKPILQPSETWKVPDGFPLPAAGFNVPPLSDADVRALQSYRARDRH